ncbi:MAG TPA: DUF4097 family beta strand repeat-containing protein [Vicinamibacteria bacterium]|nr:DUF4097 family beta strand repeat-containing protein [Vicinamibacteria bacterium]
MRLIVALAVAALLSAPGSPARADEGYWSSILSDFFVGPVQQEEFRWSGTLAAGRTLEIKGVNGSIRAEAAPGGEVQLTATKKGRRQKPEAVEIRVVEHAEGTTICAVYPTPEGREPNECVPGPKGRMNTRNNDVSVDFVVRVPSGVHLVARTVNGSVAANALGGNVTATTVNGSVTVDTAGWVLAETVNGSINASMGRTDWPGEALFETVNGSIRLSVPGTLRADLDAEVVNGSVSTSFELQNAQVARRKMSGKIGGGGRRLALETVNGSITLNRSAR